DEGITGLRLRQIVRRLRVLRQRLVSDVVDDADDAAHRLAIDGRIAVRERSGERIAVRIKAPYERAVDDHHALCVLAVVRRERPSRDELDAHRFEEAGRDGAYVAAEHAVRVWSLALRLDVQRAVVIDAKRKRGGGSDYG